MIDLSICPTFACNMNCKFCYLRNHDEKHLSLTRLFCALRKHRNNIRNLDIYGGEITILPRLYSSMMMFIAEHLYSGKIQFISNGLSIPKFWIDQFVKHEIGFSVDKSRKNKDIVYNNIRSFDRIGKRYSILTVDIDDIDDEFLSSLKNVKAVSIKPYSMPEGGRPYKSKMLESYKRIYSTNRTLFSKLERTQPDRDAVGHFFLLPDGNLYDVQYNNNREYFERAERCNQKMDQRCVACEYFGRCFNEHYSGYRVPDTGDCLGRKEVMRFLDSLV